MLDILWRRTPPCKTGRLYRTRVLVSMGAVFMGLLLGGCDDPGSVGVGLVEDGGGDPVRFTVYPKAIDVEQVTELSGSVRGTAAFSGVVSSLLAGDVDDPFVGRRTTWGYIDFRDDGVPDSFVQDSILFAELRLLKTYVYGDTTGTQRLAIREMPAAWDPADKTFSESFDAGDEIVQSSFRGSDSLLTIRLSDGWVATRQATLRSSEFNDVFHGFQIASAETRAVFGFSATGSTLRLATAADTVDLVVDRIFTHIERVSEVAAPDGTTIVRDGSGEAIQIGFDFDLGENQNGVLNRVVLRLPVDTTQSTTSSNGTFVRSPLLQLNLYGVLADGTQEQLGTTLLSTQNGYVFIGLSVSSEATFLRAVQAALLGEPRYAHLRLLPVPTSNTLNGMLIRTDDPTNRPRLELTLIPNPSN